MLHVFKHHDERVAVHTHAVELDNVLVLEVREQLSLPLKVFSGRQGRVFESLREIESVFTLGDVETRTNAYGRVGCHVFFYSTRPLGKEKLDGG